MGQNERIIVGSPQSQPHRTLLLMEVQGSFVTVADAGAVTSNLQS